LVRTASKTSDPAAATLTYIDEFKLKLAAIDLQDYFGRVASMTHFYAAIQPDERAKPDPGALSTETTLLIPLLQRQC
jgi:hypothetical protein